MALKIGVLYSNALWSHKHSNISLNTQFEQSSISWILVIENWIICEAGLHAQL